MGVEEIAVFQTASQVLQGGQKFCEQAGALITSPTAKLGYSIGAQVLKNLNAMLVSGLIAADAEFKTTQSSEKTWVSDANALPPIA